MATPSSKRSYVLYAPVDGLVVPLENVPDLGFAQGAMGAGIAVEPLGDTLYAPANGKIIHCAGTQHSVTIELAPGVAVLVHLGIDTVNLNGEGLDILVRPGQIVYRGDPLIRFDIDKTAQKASSLVTPIISVGETEFSIVPLAQGRVALHGLLAKLVPAETGEIITSNASNESASR